MIKINGYHALQIKCHDHHDIEIASSYLQDSLCPLIGMYYDEKKHSFSFLANRFCWENVDYAHHDNHFYRVHCGIYFNDVIKIQKRNFHQKGQTRVLNLLMIFFKEEDNAIHLLFSENREIRIVAKNISMYLKDFGHPWPTQKKPIHWHEHEEEFLSKKA